jgi:tetratricopeptide (TPR) repeat protein
VNREEVERLKAPYRRQLVIESVRQRHGSAPEYTLLQKEYGDAGTSDLILARGIARAAASAPAAYVPLMRRVGELNPESLSELGTYLLDRGKTAEARAVHEEWVSRSRDAVAVSNSAWWLVRHYFDTGQLRRAEALARRMAEVRSYSGLVTLADFHDWRGETSEAKALYETAAKRYGNDNERLAFYLRRVGRNPELKADANALTPQIFPKGLEGVSLREMKAAPADGVSLLDIGAFGLRNGLRKNDVIVGVDGLRVRNVRQYRVARGAGDAPDLTFLVWRDIGYLEVKGPFRFGWPISTA